MSAINTPELVRKIESTRWRIVRRRLLNASCAALATILVTATLLMAIDWAMGVSTWAGRATLTVALLATCAVAVKWWFAPASSGVEPLQVAYGLGRGDAASRGLIASALEFLRQRPGDEASAGSEALRRAVVLQASAALDEETMDRAVRRVDIRPACGVAATALIFLALLGVALRGTFTIGFLRLINPWSDVQWPRNHELTFVDPPAMLPIGADFHASLRDRRGALPDPVEIQYRTQRNGKWRLEEHRVSTTGDSVAVRRADVRDSFEYRASGGDDHSMTWQSVMVSPPPEIETLRVKSEAPEYANAVETWGDSHVKALVGSKIFVEGRLTSPASSLTLVGPTGRE
ncbi:MAG: hypothetical protein AAF961_11045, partial [Planctomycetota bacterium]